jgi:AcrR family transcriptional regulator
LITPVFLANELTNRQVSATVQLSTALASLQWAKLADCRLTDKGANMLVKGLVKGPANERETQTLDPRAKRTRQMLEQAFIELLRTKSFHSLTVQDITVRAQLNRGTFYDHFIDKVDLLDYIIRDVFNRTLEERLAQSTTFHIGNIQLLIVTLCEMIQRLHEGCVPSDQEILRRFESQMTTQIRDILLRWITNERGSHLDHARIATIVSWSIYGAAQYWEENEQSLPATEYAVKVLPLILAQVDSIHAENGKP